MTELKVKEIENIGRGIQFGICVDCNEQVVRGKFDKNFKHEVVEVTHYSANGSVVGAIHRYFDTCKK